MNIYGKEVHLTWLLSLNSFIILHISFYQAFISYPIIRPTPIIRVSLSSNKNPSRGLLEVEKDPCVPYLESTTISRFLLEITSFFGTSSMLGHDEYSKITKHMQQKNTNKNIMIEPWIFYSSVNSNKLSTRRKNNTLEKSIRSWTQIRFPLMESHPLASRK